MSEQQVGMQNLMSLELFLICSRHLLIGFPSNRELLCFVGNIIVTCSLCWSSFLFQTTRECSHLQKLFALYLSEVLLQFLEDHVGIDAFLVWPVNIPVWFSVLTFQRPRVIKVLVRAGRLLGCERPCHHKSSYFSLPLPFYRLLDCLA